MALVPFTDKCRVGALRRRNQEKSPSKRFPAGLQSSQTGKSDFLKKGGERAAERGEKGVKPKPGF